MARKKKIEEPAVEEVVIETTPETENPDEVTPEQVGVEAAPVDAEPLESEAEVEETDAEETDVDTTVEPDSIEVTSFDEWWNTEGVAGIRRGLSTKRLLVSACAASPTKATYVDLISSEAAQEVLATNKNDVRALAEIGFNL